jgi:multiple antibiotic resistance protein
MPQHFSETFNNILTVSLTLFAVIDVLGSIPVIIDLKRKLGRIDSFKATVVSAVIMILFLFLGERILEMVGIDLPSFAMAGGIVIFLIGLEMVLNRTFFKADMDAGAGSIVPIAFPLIAGAGTMTTLIALRASYNVYYEIIPAVILNLVVVFIVLQMTDQIERLLGNGGISVLRKVFGVILLAIAIKLFKSQVGIVLHQFISESNGHAPLLQHPLRSLSMSIFGV